MAGDGLLERKRVRWRSGRSGSALTMELWGKQPDHPGPPACQEVAATPFGNPYTCITLSTDNPDAIRLLKILPEPTGNITDPIVCELHQAIISDSYIALSYMWGEATATETIILNGQSFSVRQNLWDFLLQRRMDERHIESHFLWIDALCIDQDSTLEKNHQVAMMGRIFSSATLVIAWLGSHIYDMSTFDGIDEFASRPNRGRTRILSPFDITNHFSRIIGFGLYYNEYWTRAWIMQECVLAAELQVQCGSRQVTDIALSRYAGTRGDRLVMDCSAMRVLITRAKWHSMSAREYFCPWSPRSSRPSACFDPRDRVYSAVAIMNPAFGIVPDYTKTPEELFIEVSDRVIPWDHSRTSSVYKLGQLLELINGSDNLSFPSSKPAVRQILREAFEFGGSGKTRDEFLADLSLHKAVTNSSETNDSPWQEVTTGPCRRHIHRNAIS